jgi:hypothetical protein
MERLSSGYPQQWMGPFIHHLASIFLLVTMFPLYLNGQWSADPTVNTALCTDAANHFLPRTVSDGSCGTIIAWLDSRNGNTDIYAQRIDAIGVPQWTNNGVAVCTSTSSQTNLKMIGDGSGGAILMWEESERGSTRIIVQKITSAGIVQWAAGGVTICTSAGDQGNPELVGDGAGGAIITWNDDRSGTSDIYVQRIDASSVVQWSNDGIVICDATGSQDNPKIVGDQAGGAIITWADARSGGYDIYAQKIDPSGAVQWPADGVAICNATTDQTSPRIVMDGAGGAVIAWLDHRNSSSVGIYAQHVLPWGVAEWAANGVVVLENGGGPTDLQMVSDGTGGAIIGWQMFHLKILWICAQRVNSSGIVQWAANGTAIVQVDERDILSYSLLEHGIGGAIIAYTCESLPLFTGKMATYAMRLNASGFKTFRSIATATGSKQPPQLNSDGSGGAIIIWSENRTGISFNLYAQNIDASMHLGYPPSNIDVRDIPNDQGGHVSLLWDHSYLDALPIAAISGYEIYRGVSASKADAAFAVLPENTFLVKKAAGSSGAGVSMTKGDGVAPGASINWEFVADVAANKLEHYSTAVSTPSDSGPQGSSQYYYMVRAYHSSTIFWDSQPDSGSSVDNLPPAEVGTLSAAMLPNATVTIHWPANTHDPDVGRYVVYRSRMSAFTPDVTTQLATSIDTTFIDTAPPSALTVYYRVAAQDVHGNIGAPSPEAAVPMAVTRTYSIPANWNIVSVPLTVTNRSKSVLFPTAISDAYAYQCIYVTCNPLVNGTGYWLNFPSRQSVSMTGAQRTRDTLELTTGWNMIGSLSSPVSIGSIEEIPSGIVTSLYFGCPGSGYEIASSIEPMAGYWVKVRQDGRLVLASGLAKQTTEDPKAALGKLNRLIISDALGREQTLYYAAESKVDPARYELPPLPGNGCFDARFETENMVAIGAEDVGVHLTGAEYPLTIRWQNIAPASAALIVDGKETPMQRDGSIKVTALRNGLQLRLNGSNLPTEFGLDQNYPNPFNPSTVIRYALPAAVHVTLEVYNTVGARVAVLVDGTQEAGYKSAEFNAAGLSSGVYFYRLRAGTFIETKKLIVVH